MSGVCGGYTYNQTYLQSNLHIFLEKSIEIYCNERKYNGEHRLCAAFCLQQLIKRRWKRVRVVQHRLFFCSEFLQNWCQVCIHMAFTISKLLVLLFCGSIWLKELKCPVFRATHSVFTAVIEYFNFQSLLAIYVRCNTGLWNQYWFHVLSITYLLSIHR